MTINNIWDERFNTDEFIFGKSPSQFVKANAAEISANSKIFLPADGEGRNSCFLASLGHEIYACDYSKIGIDKAQKLANELGVKVNYFIANIEEYDYPTEAYDVIFAVFIQFSPSNERAKVFEGLKKAVKKGGKIYIHGYNPKQLEYKTGGPSQVENLYTKENMQEYFKDCEILKLETYDMILDEGMGHKGISALFDMIVHKN